MNGDYEWIPGSSPFPWLLVAVVFLGVGGATALVAKKRSWRPLAVATAVLVAVDFGHAVGVAWFWAGNSVFRVAQLLEGSSYQIPGWILGVIAVRLLWRGWARGRQAALFAGVSALVFTGLLDFTVLSRSQAPFDASLALDRWCVAVCLGLGFGVSLAAAVLLRAGRQPVVYEDDDVDGDGTRRRPR